MKRIIILLALLFAAVNTTTAQSPQTYIEQPFVLVRGYAEKMITPNMIYLSIVIDENDTKGKVSVAELESKMVSRLKSAGVDTKNDLRTDDIESVIKNFRREDTRTVKSYELVIYDVKTLARVYNELNSIGVSRVSVTKTSHTDIEQIKREVKIQSVVNAQADAKAMARAINQNIGAAIEISSYGQVNVRQERDMIVSYAVRASAKNIEPEALELKKITVTSDTQVKFSLTE